MALAAVAKPMYLTTAKADTTTRCAEGLSQDAWRASGRSQTARLRLARDVVRCDWLQKHSKAYTRQMLGLPDRRSAKVYTWVLGDRQDAAGPALWVLRATFDDEGRVTRTSVASQPY
jgi:hypothetical protein